MASESSRQRKEAKRSPIHHASRGAAGILVFALILLLVRPLSSPKSSPSFTVALTGKYPPFSFYSDQGELVGFDVDITRLLAKELGRKPEIITTEWDGIIAGLLADKYDAIIGSMAITRERQKQVLFSAPYYVSGAQLFVHAKTGNIKGIDDLAGQRIGVGLGETYEHYLRSNHPALEVVPYRSTVDIFLDMKNGRLSGFVTDRLVGLHQIKSAEMPFEPAGPLLYDEQMGIPVRQDNKALLRRINGALERLRNSGQLDRVHDKWFGKQAHLRSSTVEMSWQTEARLLGRGFALTLMVAGLALAIGFAVALPWGIALNQSRPLIRAPLRFFNDFVRGTPLLIQLFFVYFGAPQIGVTLSPLMSATLTLAVNCAAYMAEAVRSGLMSVPAGQRLAGISLGLTWIQVFRHIVWPQAFRVSIPPLMNIVVAFIKDTALISVISVSEVVREAQSIISVTYNPIKYYVIVAGMFFVVTFPLMKLAEKVEYRIKQKGFVHD